MKHILIVEDDAAIREGLEDLLSWEGFSVELAENGQVGIDRLNQAKRLPDVILLDIVMPVKTGIEFRNEQLKSPRLAKIPVVVMTANRMFEDSQLDAQEFLRKPIGVDELLDAIGRTQAH